MLTQRSPRDKNPAHLAFVRTLPCCICGDNTATEAAHVRMADRTVAKPMTGIAIKPDDRFVNPLCGVHHRHQHEAGNERDWWIMAGIDPVKLALALYSVSGNYEAGLRIIAANCEHVAA